LFSIINRYIYITLQKENITLIGVNKFVAKNGSAEAAVPESVPASSPTGTTGSQVLSAIFANQSNLAHCARAAAVVQRNGIEHPNDNAVLEEGYFHGSARAIATDKTVEYSGMKDYAGTDTKIMLPGGCVYDTRSLGRDNGGSGGNRQRNNRLPTSSMAPPAARKSPPPAAARKSPPPSRACISPNASSSLTSLGMFGTGGATTNRSSTKRAATIDLDRHKVPTNAMSHFHAVHTAMNRPASAVKMPCSTSQAAVNQRMQQKQQQQQPQPKQCIIDIDDSSVSSATSSNQQHMETFNSSRRVETPRTALVNGVRKQAILRVTAPIIDVDSDFIGTPDSTFGRDVELLYSKDMGLMRDVAGEVLQLKPSAGPQDLRKCFDKIFEFPSDAKMKKQKLTKRTTAGKEN